MANDAWIDDAGKKYYVAASGAMKTGWHKDGVRDGHDVWCWLDASGAVHEGWALVGGSWYYLDPADGGVMRTGRYRVGSAWYVSAPSGAMYANGWAPLGSDWYYASASGALASGWVCPGGTWYYLNPKDGNVMLHDCIETIDGDRYSFAHSGAMHASCQIKLEDDKCGYAASSGRITQIGVFKDGSVVLQDVKGNPLKRGWHALAGKWFYSADDAGSMKTGWLQDGGRWYWLESDGAMATSAWVDGGKYYVGADRIAVHAIVITARPALVIAPVFGHAKLGVIAAIAVSRMMGDVVHRHALDDGSVLAHHEVRGDALSVARPAFDDVLRGTATFGVVQDDVFLVLGWFRAVR